MTCVYLIHLDKPIGNLDNSRAQATHYIGATDNLKHRLYHHKHGTGAKMLAAANARGIIWKVVRIWAEQGFAFEQKLKRQKNARRYCPICNPKLSIDK